MAKDKKKEEVAPAEDQDGSNETGVSQALAQAHVFSMSAAVVTKVLEETVLQKAAEHLYNKYLQPKIRPYTAL